MTNLILPRVLIRNEKASGHSDNINHAFNWAGFDSLFECTIERAAPPNSPIAIALCLSVMGVKAIRARSRLGPDISALRMWYAKSASRAIHLDITPTRYPAFAAAIERVHSLAVRSCPQIAEGPITAALNSAMRPTTFIRPDRALRNSLANAPTATRRKRTHQHHKSRRDPWSRHPESSTRSRNQSQTRNHVASTISAKHTRIQSIRPNRPYRGLRTKTGNPFSLVGNPDEIRAEWQIWRKRDDVSPRACDRISRNYLFLHWRDGIRNTGLKNHITRHRSMYYAI